MNTENKTPGGNTEEQKQELAAYEKLRERVKVILSEVRESVNADTVKQAIEKAATELKEAGGHTAETVNRVAASLKKDLADAAEKLGPKWEVFSEKTSDLFEVWRDRSGVFLANAASAVGDWLQQLGSKLEHKTYRAGEMSYGGTFECSACGEHIELQGPGHLPPCAKCAAVEFRRV